MSFSQGIWTYILVLLLMTLFSNFLAADRFPKIPGDILIEKPGIRVYIPWLSSLILSVLAIFLFTKFIRISYNI